MNIRFVGILFSNVISMIHFWLNRRPTAFPHYLRHNWSICHIGVFLFSVDVSRGPVLLPIIASRLFVHRDYIWICGHQNSRNRSWSLSYGFPWSNQNQCRFLVNNGCKGKGNFILYTPCKRLGGVEESPPLILNLGTTDVYVYTYIDLLTAVGLSPGGSITGHIYTQTIHRIQITTNLEGCGPCPVFASFTLAFSLITEEKARKNLSG